MCPRVTHINYRARLHSNFSTEFILARANHIYTSSGCLWTVGFFFINYCFWCGNLEFQSSPLRPIIESLDTESSCVFLRVRERSAGLIYDNRGGQDAKRRSLYWLNTTMRHPRGETSSSAFSTRMEIVIRRKNELRTEYANRRLCKSPLGI